MEELFNIERVLGFCEKISYFFTVNLLFILSNIPVLLFLLFVGAGKIRECLPLFLPGSDGTCAVSRDVCHEPTDPGNGRARAAGL